MGTHWVDDFESSLGQSVDVFATVNEFTGSLDVINRLSLAGRIFRFELQTPQGQIIVDSNPEAQSSPLTPTLHSQSKKSSLVKKTIVHKSKHGHGSRHFSDETIGAHEDLILLARSNGQRAPKYYAMMHHTVMRIDPVRKLPITIGRLTIYIDQTETQAMLRDIMLAVLLVFSAMSILTFGTPALLYIRGKTRDKKAMQKLERQKNRYDAVSKTMPQGFCMFDGNAKVVISNEQYAEIYGLSPETIQCGTPLADILDARIARGIYVGDDPDEYRKAVLEFRSNFVDKTELFRLSDGRYVEIRNQLMPGGGWLSCQEIVTDRIESERKIAKQNMRFNAAITNMPHGFCMFDKDRKLIVSNAGFAEIYDIPVEKIQPGISFEEVHDLREEACSFAGTIPEVYARDRSENLVASEKIHNIFELKGNRFVEIRSHPLDDGGWLATHEDVTERIVAERNLTKQHDRLDAAIDNIPVGLGMFDKDGKLVISNDQFAEIYHVAVEDVHPGLGLEDILQLRIDQDDHLKATHKEYIQHHQNMVEENITHASIQQTGDDRFIEVRIHPIKEGGLLATHQDVTERIKAEQKISDQNIHLDAALSSIPMGLGMFDKDRKLVISNDLFAQIYGIPPEQLIPGIHIEEILQLRIDNNIIAPEYADEYLRKHVSLIPKNGDDRHIQQINDGRYIEVHIHQIPNGGFLATHQDVTERITAEQEISGQNMRFDAALSNIPMGLCMFDGDKNLIISNDLYAGLYGIPDDLIKPGMSLKDILALRVGTGLLHGNAPPEYTDEAYQDALSIEEKTRIHTLNDGRLIEIRCHPMEGGGWLATHEDVSERLNAEQDLSRQNMRFNAALINIPVGLCVFDGDKNLVISNDKFARIYDIDPELITPGINVTKILEMRVERGAWAGDDPDEYISGQISLSIAKDLTHVIHTLQNGRYVEVRSHPLPDGGWLATHEDITDRESSKLELEYRTGHLDAALGTMSQGLCLFDADHKVVISNDQYAEIYKLLPEQINPGTELKDIIEFRIEKGVWVGPTAEGYRAERLSGPSPHGNTLKTYELNDGRFINIRSHIMQGGGWLTVHEDVTEQARTSEALERQKQRLEAAISSMPHAFAMFDEDETILFSNAQYETMYNLETGTITPGMKLPEIINLRIENGCHICDEPAAYREEMANLKLLRTGTPRTYQLNDGRSIQIRDHPIANIGWLSIHEDVSDRHEAEAKIRFLADFDTLTNLPNRAQINQILTEVIRDATINKIRMSLFYIDLDGFKEINDTLGHPVGDLVLQEFASRLTKLSHRSIVAGRLSGDEFVIIVRQFDDLEELIDLAKLICEAGSQPIHIDHDIIEISASVGISVGPPANNEVDLLVQYSDLALYQSKSDGGNRFCFFREEMFAESRDRQRMAADLRTAIVKNQLILHYQPQVELSSGKINGYEALVRWNHPELGMVSPYHFIGLAEETGQISEIGEWVLRTACAYANTWPHEEKLSVNLSPVQFKRQDVVAMVTKALEDAGFPPERLELEITESVLIHSTDAVLATLRTLAGMGISIALDDFGTGYSSLSYLSTFPFDKIKIDKSFIDDLGKNTEVTAIVGSIIGLGRGLNSIITAEGIETRQQHELLRASGCDQGQGYLFGRPEEQILDKHNINEVDHQAVSGTDG